REDELHRIVEAVREDDRRVLAIRYGERDAGNGLDRTFELLPPRSANRIPCAPIVGVRLSHGLPHECAAAPVVSVVPMKLLPTCNCTTLWMVCFVVSSHLLVSP